MTRLVLEKTEIVVFGSTMTHLEAIMRYKNVVKCHILLVILVFYKPSSSEEALLSPHSVLTSFNMRLNLFLTLCSRISACVLDSNFLFGGKSRPLCTANSSNSCKKKKKDALKPVHKFLGQTVPFMYFI